jgi:hypothetical protein
VFSCEGIDLRSHRRSIPLWNELSQLDITLRKDVRTYMVVMSKPAAPMEERDVRPVCCCNKTCQLPATPHWPLHGLRAKQIQEVSFVRDCAVRLPVRFSPQSAFPRSTLSTSCLMSCPTLKHRATNRKVMMSCHATRTLRVASSCSGGAHINHLNKTVRRLGLAGVRVPPIENSGEGVTQRRGSGFTTTRAAHALRARTG